MISNFFIDRPIFASVISIVITLAGLVALKALPVEQYPNITPPQIQVSATYTGADAATVSNTVAAPIEQQINGVEDMIYMYSQNSSTGNYACSVFFNIGSDPDLAQINVQNRVNLALPQLPEEVKRTGVNVQKQTPNILMIIAMESPSGAYDDIFISNYANINVVNDIQRLNGVSNANIIGARIYSMRIWLRPDLMAQLKLTTNDIVQAVQDQNAQYGIGMIGRAPNTNPVQLTLPVTTLGRLSEPEQFENIILKTNADGSMVLLKDVGRVELGAQDYSVIGELDGKKMTLIAVYQQYGANALDVSNEVKKTMEKLSKNFPKGIVYSIPYDTTIFINASIREVSETIFISAALVILVVYIFLQNLRATLVPVLAMVVSIIGTMAGMYVLGFSLNTLTLFGIVLAIGIVVDDAIVVIENVERNLRLGGCTAKEAAKKAMDEVTGPVIAVVFVLVSVFIPVAFLGGIAGQLYKQFAITISVSVVFSGIVALTLSPAIAAILLKNEHKPNRFSNWFNRSFDRISEHYSKMVRWILNKAFLTVVTFLGILCLLAYFFISTPTSFVPNEDQGYLISIVNLPDGASLDRANEVSMKLYEMTKDNPALEHFISLTGYSVLENLNRTQVDTLFIVLKDWSLRTAFPLHAEQVLKKLQGEYYTVPEAQALVFNPPAIQGLGTVGGFEFWIQNRGNGDDAALEEVTNKLLEASKKRPELRGLTSNIQTDNMQLFIDLNRYQARLLGVSIADVFQTLQMQLGSLYINQFNKYGWVFQVNAQAEPKYRATIDDIGNIFVRNNKGDMVQLKSIMTIKQTRGPTLVSRFNTFTGARINGGAAPGYTSGQAIAAMEELAKENLPEDFGYSWSGEAYQEITAGGSSSSVLLGGMVMVFLILAALYERWSVPFAVILAVPFGILGAFIAIWLRGMSNDVYFQVGLVTLIALSAKNAILIVEFALQKHHEGMNVFDAAVEASKLRLRAILMTSLTTIFGAIPLVIASGAGAASRHSVGTGLMGGMISATILAIFFVPLFFKLILRYSESRLEKQEKKVEKVKNENG
jgi:multidrug efflux pump